MKKVVVEPQETTYTLSDGLFLQDDATPTLSTLGSKPALADGDIETGMTGTLTDSWSVGFDLGSSKPVDKIFLYDDATANDVGVYWENTNDSIDVYYSSNNSTWTLIDRYYPLNRRAFLTSADIPSPIPSPYPSPNPFSSTVNVFRTDFIFKQTVTARYFKLHAIKGAIMDINGDEIIPSEIEALTNAAFDSTTNEYKEVTVVNSVVTSTPQTTPGDGSGGTERPIT